MPRNGSGAFSLTGGIPVVSNTTISSASFNDAMTDIAAALTDSVAADGQTTMTGDLLMGGKKVTGMGSGAASTDAVNIGQLAAASGPGLLGFSHSASYAAGTTGAKLADLVSVKDAPYNAKGDGVTDDTAAIQAAIDYAATSKAAIFFPPGNYLVGSTLFLPDQTSNPYTRLFMYGHSGIQSSLDGVAGGVSITTTASSLFKTKTAVGGSGALPNVELLLDGLQFRTDYINNPTAICFNLMSLWGSIIQRCSFYGFDSVLVGSFVRVSVFNANTVGARRFIKRNASYSNGDCADSFFSYNYIDGLGGTTAGMVTDALIDITNAAQVTIAKNYIDFTYKAIATGGANQNVVIEGNVLDLCYSAIEFEFGTASCAVKNNQFFNINKSKVDLFPSPVAGMSSNNWACIRVANELCANKIIEGNQYNTADAFMLFGTKGHWNIVERDNTGLYPNSLSGLPVAAVDFGTRAIDTATYPLDNQYLSLGSIHDKVSTNIRGKRSAYIGLEYLFGSPPVKVRVNDDYSLSDMLGSYLWGKTNLLSATDFAAGWTFASGVTNPGGVFTASSGNGWSYYGLAVGAGTYVVCLDITTVSGGGAFISAGYSLSGTPTTYNDGGVVTNLGTASGSLINAPGRCFYQLTVPSTTARFAVFLNAGTNCTIDYVHVVKVA